MRGDSYVTQPTTPEGISYELCCAQVTRDISAVNILARDVKTFFKVDIVVSKVWARVPVVQSRSVTRNKAYVGLRVRCEVILRHCALHFHTSPCILYVQAWQWSVLACTPNFVTRTIYAGETLNLCRNFITGGPYTVEWVPGMYPLKILHRWKKAANGYRNII